MPGRNGTSRWVGYLPIIDHHRNIQVVVHDAGRIWPQPLHAYANKLATSSHDLGEAAPVSFALAKMNVAELNADWEHLVRPYPINDSRSRC